MGACCGREEGDKEIEKCTSLEAIIQVLIERKNKLPEEQREIQEYLQDQSKTIKSINIEGITKEMLEKRPAYLDVVSDKYGEIINILYNNPKLDLAETKSYIENITRHYFLTYDPNNNIDMAFNKFKEYVASKKN